MLLYNTYHRGMAYITTFLVVIFFGIFMGFSNPRFVASHSPTLFAKPTITISSIIAYGPEYFENSGREETSEATNSARFLKYQDILIESRDGKVIVPVVMYHYIEKYVDPQDTMKQKLTVMLPEFENQLLAWKKSGYETLFAKDLSKNLIDQKVMDKRAVALTFDDGYEDFYLYVFPLLKKNKAKATVYVISGYIGRQGFLTREQIRELSKSGYVEIGGHTVNHVYLKGLSRQTIAQEILNGKKEIEKLIGEKIETFAYPFGAYSLDAEVATINAEYDASFTTQPGIIHESTKTTLLSRVRPHQINYNDIDSSLVKIYNEYK